MDKKTAESRGNLSWGMQFRTCENFWTSTDFNLVESPKIFTNTKATPQSLRLRFCESQNLTQNNAKIAESSVDSANQNKSFCYFWLIPKVESHLPLKPNLPNSAESSNGKVESTSDSRESILDEKSGLCSHERGNRTNGSLTKRVANSTIYRQKTSMQTPKFRSIIVGASGLSLGISIVVAIMLGIGAGILMQKIFGVFWVLFLGVFWGIAAAILNVYKVYKAELRDFENLANNPKYKGI